MQISERYEIKKLDWDTSFFGLNCAKVILKKEINVEDVNRISEELEKNKIQFATIQNIDNNDNNNYIMNEFDKAFLADVNIQFMKEIDLKVKN